MTKSINPKTKNIVWKYTETTPDLPKAKEMRLMIDKDGYYTYALKGISAETEGKMIKQKLEELIGFTLKKRG